ncbi:MAG TPA: type II secretion system minor pseudopilin GspH [Pseudomonadales bacterium]|nr:type II secretion system minor pseudopilin GspH [Pseudomonadales bacterium]
MKYFSRLESGFTLLELLMVVFVVGIMAGLTVMSVGGNTEREFRRDVARMQQVLGMAQDEAPFGGEEIGFWLDPEEKKYRFLRFDETELKWLPFDKEGFTEHQLPEQYQMELEMSGDPVDLAELYKEVYKLDDKLKDSDEKPLVPWLVFFSDGHYTPFRLWLSSPLVKDSVYVLEGDGLGDIHFRLVAARDKPELSHD